MFYFYFFIFDNINKLNDEIYSCYVYLFYIHVLFLYLFRTVIYKTEKLPSFIMVINIYVLYFIVTISYIVQEQIL